MFHAVPGRVTEICRIQLWDLESSTLLPIYYYIYNYIYIIIILIIILHILKSM
jgi:hypothetical protein